MSILDEPSFARCPSWGLAAAVLVGFGCGCTQEPPGPAPDRAGAHLLLVMVDTLRADHCSAYGYPRQTTPHLQRLAERGARFDAAYAPSATTGPSHATLFTSLHPLTHGVVKNGLPLAREHTTLAETLRAAGYDTAAVLGSYVLHRKFGFDQGFAAFEDDFDPRTATVRIEQWEGHRLTEGFDRPAAETTDRAIRWLRAGRNPERPFFLFVHYFDPHDPYVSRSPYAERFTPADPEQRRDRAVSLYDAEVAYTDAQIGRLLAELQAQALVEDTLVVVAADHGEGLFDHGFLYHDIHLYEEAVRVPLLFRWPGTIRAGRVLDGPVALGDVLPTVLDLLDVKAPRHGLQGRSLAAALRGQAALDPLRPVYLQRRAFNVSKVGDFSIAGEKFAIRAGWWKYIEAPMEGTRELFHLERDPGERRNLATRHPNRAERLSHRLAGWKRRQTGRARGPAAVPPEERRRLEALGYAD